MPSVVAPVEIQSFKLSWAAAHRVPESIFLLSFRLNAPIQSLTRMDSANPAITNRLNSTGSGCMIFPMELFTTSKPTSNTKNVITNPLMYSIRPCPKGWSSSAGAAAARKPIKVTTPLPTSERLLNASPVMAMELEISPNMNFAANNNKLQTIATQLLSMPYRSRTLGELV